MIAAFDWLLAAKHDKKWKQEIYKALDSDNELEITRGKMYRLMFRPEEQYVYISAYSKDSDLSWKIIPKKLPYKAVRGFLENEAYDFFEDAIEY